MVDLNLSIPKFPRGINPKLAPGWSIKPTKLLGLDTHVENVLSSVKWNAAFFLSTADVPTVSQVAGKLATTSVRLENPEPVHSVEDSARWQMDGLNGAFHGDLDKLYVQYRKNLAGGDSPETIVKRLGLDASLMPQRIISGMTGSDRPMSSAEFGVAVVKSKRSWFATEPYSQVPEVVAMVKNLDKNIFKPLLEEGIKHGVFENPAALTDPIKQQTYLPQVWNVPNIRKNRPGTIKLFIDNHKENVNQGVEGYKEFPDSELIEIYNGVIDNLIGSHDGLLRTTSRPKKGSAGKKSPAKTRQIDINPYMMESFEDAGLLVNDLNIIVSRYVRAMVPQIRFAEMFGALNFEEHFKHIDNEYNELIIKYANDPIKTNSENKKNERMRLRLEGQKVLSKKYLQDTFDRVMGYAGIPDDPSAWVYRGVDMFKKWNIPVMLGSIVASSLTDPGLHVARQGLRPMGKTILQLFTNANYLFEFITSSNELQNMANIHEIINNTFLRAQSGVSDRPIGNTMIERASDRVVGISGLATGLSFFDHYMKSFSVLYNSQHIAEISIKYAEGNDLSEAEELFRHDMRLSPDDLMLLAEQYDKHGAKSYNGVHIFNMKEWDRRPDIQKLSDKIGISVKTESTKSQNIPTAMSTPMMWKNDPIFGALMQFKQFIWTLPEKIFIPAMQGPNRRIIESLVVGVTLGAIGLYWKARSRGETHEEALDIPPEELIVRALMESGWFAHLEQGNRLMEDITGGKAGLGQMVMGEPLSKGYTTDKMDTTRWLTDLGGPSVGQAVNVGLTGSLAYKYFFDPRNMKKEELWAARKLIPFQNHILLRNSITEYQESLQKHLRIRR